MSEELIKEIESLIEEGNSFNLSNSSSLSGLMRDTLFGKKIHLSREYERWKTVVDNLILSQCGLDSPIYGSFISGAGQLENNDFDQGHGRIMGSLHATLNAVRLRAKRKKDKSKADKVSSRDDRKTEKDEKIPLEGKKKVFVVHGHDEKLKNQLEIFLTEIGLQPVVLHRKPDEGMTIVEKFEKHSDVGYAFILLSPDDALYSINGEDIPEEKRSKEMRARQNVIWEFGFFVGRLGRNRVCCLYKEGVKLPTDVSGMLYKRIRNNVEEAAFAILKDLRAAGYDLQVP